MRCLVHAIAALAIWNLGLSVAAQPPAQQPQSPPREAPQQAPKPKEISSGTVIGGKTLQDWIQDLKDRDPSIRENGLATLKLYGAVAREAVPLILKLFRDTDASVRVNAVIALGLIGMDEPHFKDGVAALVRALSDKELIVRYHAAMSLGRLGPDARDAIPNLIPLVRSDSYASGGCWEVRKAAVFALGSISMDRDNGPDPRATAALVSAFNDISSQVRLEAVIALIVLGPSATGRDKLLIQQGLLGLTKKERNKHVLIWAHVGLMRMDGVDEGNLQAISKHLKATEATVRSHVGRALGTIGPEAKSRVPELIDAIQHEDDPQALIWLVWGLARVHTGDPAPRAIKALEELQKHKLEAIRLAAAEGLAMIRGKPVQENQLPSR